MPEIKKAASEAVTSKDVKKIEEVLGTLVTVLMMQDDAKSSGGDDKESTGDVKFVQDALKLQKETAAAFEALDPEKKQKSVAALHAELAGVEKKVEDMQPSALRDAFCHAVKRVGAKSCVI